MGSVRPARRFDALRALAGPSLPSRLSPDGGPPCAFAPLQRSIAAPPHRPADPRARSPDDASSPGLSCPTTHAGAADPFPRSVQAPQRAASGVWYPPRGLHHRPSPALRRGASLGLALQGVLLEAIGTPREVPCPRGVRRVGSPRPHGERADAVACRASIPLRARSAVPDPEGPGAPMPSWASPLQSSNPPPLASALCSRSDPLARVGWDRRPVPPASQGVGVRET
jgi:hypothetical protein